jgi:hypothetical protein
LLLNIARVVHWLEDQEVNRAVDTSLKIVAAVGGLWWFSRRSAHLPRLNLEQAVNVYRVREVEQEVFVVKAILIIKNVGEVPFSLRKFSVGAIQTLPLPERIQSEILDGGCLIDESVLDERDSAWTGLAAKEVTAGKNWNIEVRSQETEVIPCTLRIADSDALCVTIISQLWQSRTLRRFWRRPLTWRVHTLVNLTDKAEDLMQENKAGGMPVVVPQPSGGSGGFVGEVQRSGTAISIKVPGGGGKKNRR